MNNKHYLYQHIRLDTNEVFYIGIGTKNKNDLKSSFNSIIYRRAYSKSGRNNIWKHITNKTNYKVYIVLESNDYEYIKQKEIEYISIYRKKSNGGTLSNLTNGGDGSVGYKMTDFQKKKLSDKLKLRKGSLHHRSKKVYVYKMNGSFYKMWESRRQCALELGIDKGCIDQGIKNKITQCFGYVFKDRYLGEYISKVVKKRTKGVNILDPITNNILFTFDSVTEAAKFLKSQSTNISKACKDKNKTVKGYKMEYIINTQEKGETNIEDET